MFQKTTRRTRRGEEHFLTDRSGLILLSQDFVIFYADCVLGPNRLYTTNFEFSCFDT